MLLGILLVGATGSVWMANECRAPGVVGQLSAGCLEYWLNRYQTLIAGLVALSAAYIAVRPVWRQLAEMQRQTMQVRLEFLRRRSVEVEREVTLIYEVTSSIDLMANAIVQFHNGRVPMAGFTGAAVLNLKSTEMHMNNMIERFVRELGPLWGDVAIHAARATVRDDAQRLSVELAKFTGPIVPGMQIGDSEFNHLGLTLAPLKKSVWDAATVVHVGIVAERKKIGTQIADLDKALAL